MRSCRRQTGRLRMSMDRNSHELITTAILKIQTQHQWTHARFRQVLQNKYDGITTTITMGIPVERHMNFVC